MNCIPACKTCVVAGHCPEPVTGAAQAVMPWEAVHFTRAWRPNDGSEDIRASCGCTVPWPAVVLICKPPRQVLCDRHGWSTITEPNIKLAKKKMAQTLPTLFDTVIPF